MKNRKCQILNVNFYQNFNKNHQFEIWQFELDVKIKLIFITFELAFYLRSSKRQKMKKKTISKIKRRREEN